MKNRISFYAGILALPALQAAFLLLKLTNSIRWSWWWVLSPLFVIVAASITVTVVGVIFYKKSKHKDQ